MQYIEQNVNNLFHPINNLEKGKVGKQILNERNFIYFTFKLLDLLAKNNANQN